MAGRGLRCPNWTRMSQIPDPNMDPKGVKYPYLQAEPLPPNRHQTNRKYCSKFYYQQKVGLSVCSTLWLNKPRLLVLRVALVPCSQGWQAPHSSSFPWFGKKRVSLADTSERQSAVGSELRTLLSRTKPQRTLPGHSSSRLWVPSFSSEVVRFRRAII